MRGDLDSVKQPRVDIPAVIHCESDKSGDKGSREARGKMAKSDECDFRSCRRRFFQVDRAALMVR